MTPTSKRLLNWSLKTLVFWMMPFMATHFYGQIVSLEVEDSSLCINEGNALSVNLSLDPEFVLDTEANTVEFVFLFNSTECCVLMDGITEFYEHEIPLSEISSNPGLYNLIVSANFSSDDGTTIPSELSNSLPINLVAEPSFVINQSGEKACWGQEFTLTAAPENLNYTWPDGSMGTSFTKTFTQAEILTVMATDSIGCSSTGSTQINVDTFPQADLLLPDELTICPNQTEILTIGIDSLPSYLWTDGSEEWDGQEISLTTTAPEKLIAVVVNENNCINTDSVEISVSPLPDTLNLPEDTVACKNQSMQIIVGLSELNNLTYNWNVPSLPNNDSLTFVPIAELSNLFLTVTDEYACSLTDSIAIQAVESVDFISERYLTVCENEMIAIQSNNDGSYFGDWHLNDTIYSNTNGIFFEGIDEDQTIIVYPNISCAAVDTLTIFSEPSPEFTVSMVPNQSSFCLGEMVTISALGSESDLLLLNGAEFPGEMEFEVNNDLALVFQALNDNLCSSIQELNLTLKNPEAVFFDEEDIEMPESVFSQDTFAIVFENNNEGICHEWEIEMGTFLRAGSSCDDVFIDSLSSPRNRTAQIANYYFTINSENCVSDEILKQVKVYPSSTDNVDLFIPEIFTPNFDGVNDQWEIEILSPLFEASNFKLSVVNRFGSTVYEDFLDTQWSGEGAIDGTYWYVIVNLVNQQEYIGPVTLIRE